MEAYYFFLSFFVYGFLGWCAEVAFAAVKERRFVNRGFLNGPLCPVYGIGVGLVVQLLNGFSGNLVLLYITSTILVTVIEWMTGFLLEKLFHHKWWDYSEQPLNIGGYICLTFSLVWGVCCVLIVKVIHPVVEKGLQILPVPAGIVLIIGLGIALFADLWVTASGILKLNRQLEAMEKIAGDLREFSDKLGSNISENVLDTIERQEEGKKRLEEAAEQSRKRLEEAAEQSRKRLEELALSGGRVSRRLLKAFPKMESRRHKEMLDEIRKRMRGRR